MVPLFKSTLLLEAAALSKLLENRHLQDTVSERNRRVEPPSDRLNILYFTNNKFPFSRVTRFGIHDGGEESSPLPAQTNHWARLSPPKKPRRHFLGICGRKEVISFKSSGSYSLMRKFLHFTSAGIVSRENVSCGQNSIPTITFPIIIRWQMDTPLCFLGSARCYLGSTRTLDNLNCAVRGQKISSSNKLRWGLREMFICTRNTQLSNRHCILCYLTFDLYLRESLRSFILYYLLNL